MKLPFTSSAERRDKQQERQRYLDAKHRERMITNETVSHIRRLVGTSGNGATRVATVSFWNPSSHLEVMYYRKYTDPEVRATAIEADITFFRKIVERERARFPKCLILIKPSEKDKRIPAEILVSKK